MNFILRLFRTIGQGLWKLLTRGLQISWAWLRDGFFHALAGGAVSGSNKILDHARTTAGEMGVRGSTAAISYGGGSSGSSASVPAKAKTSSFMEQFL